jgi:hypothetical protein
MQKLTAKCLIVDCKTPYVDRQVLLNYAYGPLFTDEEERFKAYEFENGLIRLPNLPGYDRYFKDRTELWQWKPDRRTSVAEIKEAGFTCDFFPGAIHDSIARSIEEFGSVPEKYKELLTPLFRVITQLRNELDRLGASSIMVVPDEEASEELRIEEIDASCYSDHIDIQQTLANWRQLPDGAGAKVAWLQLVDSGRPVLRGLD